MSFSLINLYDDAYSKATDGLFDNFDNHVKLGRSYQIGMGEYVNIASPDDKAIIFGTPIMRSSGLKMWDDNSNGKRPRNMTVQMDFYGGRSEEFAAFKDGLTRFDECMKDLVVRDCTTIFKNGKAISSAALNAKWLPTIKSDIDGKYSDKIPVKLPSKLVDGETIIDLDQVEFYNADGVPLVLDEVMAKFEDKYTFDAILQPVKLNFYGSKASMPLVAVQIKFHRPPTAPKKELATKGLGCMSSKRAAEDDVDDTKRQKTD